MFLKPLRVTLSIGCAAVLAATPAFAGIDDGTRDEVTNAVKVNDAQGNPVKGAFVSYTSIGKRFSWSYTNTGGTTAIGRRQHTAGAANFSPIVKNGTISIPVTSGERVVTEVFELGGRKVTTLVSDPAASNGLFTYRPLAGVRTATASQVYLVKVSCGDLHASVRMMNLGTHAIGNAGTVALSAQGTITPLAKTAAAVDTLRIGKNGYIPVKVPVSSYTEDAGTVTLVKLNVEAIVDSIYATMNTAKKAGQLYQTNLGRLDEQPPSYIQTNFVGSIMCGGGDEPSLSPPHNVNKNSLIDTWYTYMERMNTASNNAGFPLFIGIDNVHGLNKTVDGTILPHNLGMGCSFDPQFIELAYRMVATEIAGINQSWVLGPCAAVPRDDRWGRLYEGFGEEPTNVATMVKAAVLGFQTSDLSNPRAIATCLKHFVDGCAEDGKNDADQANVTGTNEGLTKQQILTIHTKPYIEAFKVGATSVMVSYTNWFGTPMHQSSELLTDVLRGQLKFKGWVNGDWQAHMNGRDKDGNPSSLTSAVTAGIDVCMPGHWWPFIETMLPEYKQYIDNNVNTTRSTTAVKSVLRQKVIKYFSNGFRNFPSDNAAKGTIGSAEHHKIARIAARKSMVLVKNSSALPVAKSAKIAVVGWPLRHEGLMCGGWTYKWQGNPDQDIAGCTSIFEGLQAQNSSSSNVTYSRTDANIASGKDVAFVGIGEAFYAEAEFPDIEACVRTPFQWADTIRIEYDQKALIRNVAGKAGKTILVVLCGRPINITDVADLVDGIIIAWWPGSEGGNALADLAYGEVDFTAKLAYTWPRSLAQQPINYGYPGTGTDNYKGQSPLFPYDFGLNLAGQELPKGMYTQVSVQTLED